MRSWLLKTASMVAPLLTVVLPLAASIADAAQDATPRFVAGLTPNRRPADAPVIREPVNNSQWSSRLLTGISEPIPVSLGFLDNQGAWYTPFTRPGMLGYYDLRKWHQGCAQLNQCTSLEP